MFRFGWPELGEVHMLAAAAWLLVHCDGYTDDRLVIPTAGMRCVALTSGYVLCGAMVPQVLLTIGKNIQSIPCQILAQAYLG